MFFFPDLSSLNTSNQFQKAIFWELCASCNRILRGNSREYLQSRKAYEYKVHHQSSRSFLEAVEQRCLICCRVWRYSDEKYRAVYTGGRAFPLSFDYRLYMEESEEDIILRLDVRHSSPIISEAQDVPFCLIPWKGKSTSVFIYE